MAKKLTHLSVFGCMVFALAVFASNARAATISFVKPRDAAHQVEEAKKSEVPLDVSREAKSRAPEPNTFVLFGSGILGMIVSFLRRTYSVTKRVLDILGSFLALVISSPLCLFIILLIKMTSKGPVLYTQIRVGKGGHAFEIYKFRTMKIDAEKETGPVWAKTNDNRLTPIGHFLRKSHMDEIPQFINVLKGDMSIIGPRPERPVFVEEFKKTIVDYNKRLGVKPGITGLAQVWHRYDETIADVRKKIKYDILYIKEMCLLTDIRIVLRTARVVLLGVPSKPH